MRVHEEGSGGGQHIGLVILDQWWAEHNDPPACRRIKSMDGDGGLLTVRPPVTKRRRRVEYRSIMPFDVFMIAAGAYDARYYQRSKARRDAMELRERFGLSGLI